MTNPNYSSKKLQSLFFPQNKEEKEIPVHENPVLKITGEAYKKINLYSKIVSEIFGRDIECGGRMLNYKGMNDGVIRDAYLQYQRVNSGDGDLMDNPSVDKDYVQSRGMSWAGMWHSHGGIAPFHSGYDNNRLESLHNTNKQQRLCMLKSNPKSHYQRKTVRDNKLILEYDLQPLSITINFDSNETAKAAAENIEIHDNVFYTPSLVINKDEYLNDGPGKEYYAEFWVGNGRNPDTKVKDVKLEIIEENNNILPSLEEIVLEVGEKVKYAVGNRINDPGIKLKNYPNYNKVLEKYKRIDSIKNSCKKDVNVEQIVNNEKKIGEPNLTEITQVQQDITKQEIEHNQELYKTKTYMGRLEEFYDSLNSHNDSTDKTLAELCRIYSGKQYRFWSDRFEKGNEVLKELKKKYLASEQKKALENIREILSSNKYLKRKHSSMYYNLQRRLDSNNPHYYNKNLEGKVQNTNNPTNVPSNPVQPRKTIGSYLKSIAKYVGIAAMAAAMVILPAKYCQKNDYNKPAVIYTVKKSDNLWNLTKDYLKRNNVKVDDKTVYKAVDKVAEHNGKGKQAEYKIGGKEKRNPHYIKPGQKISFPKKVLDLVQQEGKK